MSFREKIADATLSDARVCADRFQVAHVFLKCVASPLS